MIVLDQGGTRFHLPEHLEPLQQVHFGGPAGGVKVNKSGEAGTSKEMLSNFIVSLVLVGALLPGIVIWLTDSS